MDFFGAGAMDGLLTLFAFAPNLVSRFKLITSATRLVIHAALHANSGKKPVFNRFEEPLTPPQRENRICFSGQDDFLHNHQSGSADALAK